MIDLQKTLKINEHNKKERKNIFTEHIFCEDQYINKLTKAINNTVSETISKRHRPIGEYTQTHRDMSGTKRLAMYCSEEAGMRVSDTEQCESINNVTRRTDEHLQSTRTGSL